MKPTTLSALAQHLLNGFRKFESIWGVKSIDVHYEETACFSLRNDSHLKFYMFFRTKANLTPGNFSQ